VEWKEAKLLVSEEHWEPWMMKTCGESHEWWRIGLVVRIFNLLVLFLIVVYYAGFLFELLN
jgi:hypothetical protein